MLIAVVASISPLLADPPHQIQTYAYINVAPNPCGLGQTVTVNFWLAVPHADAELATNMTVKVTHPDGTTETLGPFTSDLTGGTFTRYTPTTTGNYTFQFLYGGQTLAGAPNMFGGPTFAGYTELPSQSEVKTLTVTDTPATGYAITPLPGDYWQTPVNSENVQTWAGLTGSWMGYAANTFAITGAYNATGSYNPYTQTPNTAHVIWTKPWCVGGVSGGELGNDEQNSNFWTTSQYDPKYAPVIMNGIMYSTWYTTTTSSQQGIIATDLYTGKTLFVINTTYALRSGMQVNFENINQYGVVGPYIIAQSGGGLFSTGPINWFIFDAMTGQYLCEVMGAPSFNFVGQDANGNIIGYAWAANNGTTIPKPVTAWNITAYPNGRFGAFGNAIPGITYQIKDTNVYGPALIMYNLTAAMQQSGLNWAITQGTVYQWQDGIEWINQPLPPVVDGITTTGLGTSSFGYQAWSGDTLVMTTGATSVEETYGWLVEAGFNAKDGSLMWIANHTGGAFVPYTRTSNTPSAAAGVYVEINQATYDAQAFSLTTGKLVWEKSLNVTMSNGKYPNDYDEFDFETVPDTTHGILYVWALGGDVWALDMKNGNILWTYTTDQANGDAGTETPYGIYPLWVFSDEALAGQDSPVLYLPEGHEYSPPLFHNARMLALNGTTGKLMWTSLGFYDTATAVAYGVLTSFNSYDGQIYAYARGPSRVTVNAPQIGVSTATPVTITGTVTDISAGASQAAVAANFPNGLPAVSDDSQTGFMEAVYQQQPMPYNTTGVPIDLFVTDANGNYRMIGSTTSTASGTFSYTWTPDISGTYTITAVFQGSGAYYPSSAQTAFYASEGQTTAPTATTNTANLSSSDFTLGVAAIIVAIIIVGALLGLLMLRKRP
jgi:PQQ enzyme repeat.